MLILMSTRMPPVRRGSTWMSVITEQAAQGLQQLGLWLIGSSVLAFIVAMPAHAQEKGFRRVVPGYTFAFPEDHGAHPGFRTEWWYYTGHLRAADGRRFGFQLTFFRRGIAHSDVRTNPSRWAIRHLYLAHFALTDIAGKQFQYAEKISRPGLGKAGAEEGRLHVWIDRWHAEARTGGEAHRLKADADGFAIDLNLKPTNPPVVHGDDGLSRKGDQPGQASHYYSLTRLATRGTVILDEARVDVEGTSWMDHEFGSADLGSDLVGWDWFSIQLDDETEVMVYQLRHADGTPAPVSSGTLVFSDGRTKHLAGSDFRIDVLDSWTSPRSGARYPSGWRLTLVDVALRITLTPVLADQELVTRRSTQVTYWEGAVRIHGTHHGRRVEGQGYVELTGYDRPFQSER